MGYKINPCELSMMVFNGRPNATEIDEHEIGMSLMFLSIQKLAQ
jgi:hypothetical protein